MVFAGEYSRPNSLQPVGSDLSSLTSVPPPSTLGSTVAVLSHTGLLVNPLRTTASPSTVLSSVDHCCSTMSSQTLTLPQLFVASSSVGFTYTEPSLPSITAISAGLSQQVRSTLAKSVNSVPSHHFVGQSQVRSTLDAGTNKGKQIQREKVGSRNYSYISNASSMEGTKEDSRDSDSFLPEPKKRLFESEDEVDFGSRSKTTKTL